MAEGSSLGRGCTATAGGGWGLSVWGGGVSDVAGRLAAAFASAARTRASTDSHSRGLLSAASRGFSAGSRGLLSAVPVSGEPRLRAGAPLPVVRAAGVADGVLSCAGAGRGSLASAETGGAGETGWLGGVACTGWLAGDAWTGWLLGEVAGTGWLGGVGWLTLAALALGAATTGAGVGEDQNPPRCAMR